MRLIFLAMLIGLCVAIVGCGDDGPPSSGNPDSGEASTDSDSDIDDMVGDDDDDDNDDNNNDDNDIISDDDDDNDDTGGDSDTDTDSDTDSDTDTDTDTDSDHVFSIHFDYRYDEKGFFDDSIRQNTMTAAAMIWSQHILDDFEMVPAETALRTRHPEHPSEDGFVFELSYDIDDIVILVGVAAIEYNATSNRSYTNQVEDKALLARLEERYYGSDFEPWISKISFNETLDWFFDTTPETDDDIPEDEMDIIAVTLHELGHLLGIGTAQAFEAYVVDNHFEGPKAMEIYGGPVPLTSDGIHISGDTILIDVEEYLMDPGTKIGMRKTPSILELAILEDIGYQIDW